LSGRQSLTVAIFKIEHISRGHLPPSPAVVMAVSDEKSLDAEGRWPWQTPSSIRLPPSLNERVLQGHVTDSFQGDAQLER
jgi:hypothetical protein